MDRETVLFLLKIAVIMGQCNPKDDSDEVVQKICTHWKDIFNGENM